MLIGQISCKDGRTLIVTVKGSESGETLDIYYGGEQSGLTLYDPVDAFALAGLLVEAAVEFNAVKAARVQRTHGRKVHE